MIRYRLGVTRTTLRRWEPGLYDPAWLRRTFTRCLFDGHEVADDEEFCSVACEEGFAAWVERMKTLRVESR